MFSQTQWPSPEEYSQLEVQTSLGRTDIVRWFKDHRSALKNGETLEWMEALQNENIADQQKANKENKNNVQLSEKPLCFSIEALAAKADSACENTTEHSKRSDQEKVQWSDHSVTDLSQTRADKTGDNAADNGRWVKVTLAMEEETAAAESQRLTTDSDILTLEQPGKVTG